MTSSHRRIPPAVLEQAQRRARGRGGDLTPSERAHTLRELGHHAEAARALAAQPIADPTREQRAAERAFAEEWGRYRTEMLQGGLMLCVALNADVETRRVVYDLDGQAVAEHPRP